MPGGTFKAIPLAFRGANPCMATRDKVRSVVPILSECTGLRRPEKLREVGVAMSVQIDGCLIILLGSASSTHAECTTVAMTPVEQLGGAATLNSEETWFASA